MTTIVKSVPEKGRGVFASKAISKGATIEVAHLLKLSPSDVQKINETALSFYIFELPGGGAAIGLGTASLYNHSDHPNARFDVANDHVSILAARDITAGEEVSIDYEWDESMRHRAGIPTWRQL